jgi:hypothetical protein
VLRRSFTQVSRAAAGTSARIRFGARALEHSLYALPHRSNCGLARRLVFLNRAGAFRAMTSRVP